MDMVTMNIIDSAMVAICREMGVNVQKTAYSTIFSEAEDFTCALASPEGEMISVAEFCPAQIGGVPLLVRSMVREIGPNQINEGDVIVHNDPYRGGLHTPEHTMFKPIFVDGELMGFAVCIGHFVEVGGMVPGGFPGEATEIFHEGLRVPPVKIIKRGEDVPEVWKLLLANVRTPRGNYGDLRALISAVDLGERRLKELIGKYGKPTFRQTVSDLMDYSEARMRAEIKAFPDGHYEFEDFIEDDGIENKEYKIKVTMHIQGDEVVIDYTGSSPQAKGPINATLGVAWSASYNAMLNLTDPSIPKNSGCFRPIRVVAPAGTVMNVNYPGSEVGGNTETHPLIVACILGAMSEAAPDRVMASEGTTHGCFVFGGYDELNDEPFGAFDFSYVGYGGRSFADGNDATDSINGNCANTPTEVFETRFPWIVEEYALRQDSAGAGEHRGGFSISKTMLATGSVMISQMTNKHKRRAWGLKGGKEGLPGATLYLPANGNRWQTISDAFGKISPSKYSNVPIKPGERVSVKAPGGGGYGDPKKRDKRLIVDDVLDGFISKKAAKSDYGFEDRWVEQFGGPPPSKAAE
ncbi:MAG: hydantoinase B/oxoprolinase family protein [Alphaproteobacteria bacterium]|nr:hydantoinase B/oxoprolinase family protein [Alphaproteobacteria bacterium]